MHIQSPVAFKLGYILLTIPLLFGCSDDDESPQVLQGTFIDSVVKGIEFSSPSQSGVTDSSGTFSYC